MVQSAWKSAAGIVLGCCLAWSAGADPATSKVAGHWLTEPKDGIIQLSVDAQGRLSGEIVGGIGVVLSAVYLLWMIQRVLFGRITKHEIEELDHLSVRERFSLLPPVAMAILMGVTPMLFLKASFTSVDSVRAIVESQASRAAK